MQDTCSFDVYASIVIITITWYFLLANLGNHYRMYCGKDIIHNWYFEGRITVMKTRQLLKSPLKGCHNSMVVIR